MAGPIRVVRPIRVGLDAFGLWECEDRRIRVQARCARGVAWQILLHELIHAALYDAGCVVLDLPGEKAGDREEVVCDVVGSAMMHVVAHLVAGASPTA